MKKLLIIISIIFCIQNTHANKYYLFTNSLTRESENRKQVNDYVIWLFDTKNKTITLFTEYENVILNYKEDTTIKESSFDKYIITDNSSVIYVDKETLQIVYIIDKKQFIFKP